VDGVVDLLGGEAAAAHRHAVPVEDVADRAPFDAEPVAELVHRRTGLVARFGLDCRPLPLHIGHWELVAHS